jgi:small-conductance mechanosensitive channel
MSDIAAWILRTQRELAWAPEWVTTCVVLAVFAAAALALHGLIFRALRRVVRGRDLFWRAVVDRARVKLRIVALILALAAGVSVSPLNREPSDLVRQVLAFAFVLVLGWLAAGAVDIWSTLYQRRFKLDVEDNLVARKHVTQIRILQRVVVVLIGVVSLGLALMTIGGVRQWGVSLLASAGAASLVAGLALQPLLTNLIAGVQIAVTQPIRIDDAVIVEGEWGQIEEITSTYVVVRLWDWRRMVLPLTYFIQKPFQNWTRESASLIGTVMLYADYAVPVDRVREKLEAIARASRLWDGKVVNLQVSDAGERTVQLRCLVSARNAPETWDLRCEVREKLIGWLQQELPHVLPRDRVEGAWEAARDGPAGPPPVPVAH